jgi:regulator of sigma E protease
MTTLLSFLAAIAILVFVHEMGHYLAARQCGVQVLRFSIGFGKELLQWTSKKSGTQWVIAAIPLGGYVRMQDASFEEKPLRSRAWIVFAGPLANLIFAALAYASLGMMGRQEALPVLGQPEASSPAAQSGLVASDRVLAVDGNAVRSFSDIRWRLTQAMVGEGRSEVRLTVESVSGGSRELTLRAAPLDEASSAAAKKDPARMIESLGLVPLSRSVKIAQVQEASPAAVAGLRAGDVIIRVNGQNVTQPAALIQAVQKSNGQPVELVVSDGSLTERVVLTPQLSADGVYRVGAVLGADIETVRVSDGPWQALLRGTARTWEMTELTFQALGRMLMGDLSWRQISGPVTIADAAGQSAQGGLQSFIGFLALISISIAVLNLLPIPMLDGGHLLYYLWELVRGQPLPAEAQEMGRRMGLGLIAMLTFVALFNDFSRLAGW